MGEAAEPGALPGTSREAFPGVSLHPTDFGVHLIPTPRAPHCQGSRINPTTQTLHCASAVGKRALQEQRQVHSCPGPPTPHSPITHTPTRLGVRETDTVVFPCKLLPHRAALRVHKSLIQGAAGALGLERRMHARDSLSLSQGPFSRPSDSSKSLHFMMEKVGLGT